MLKANSDRIVIDIGMGRLPYLILLDIVMLEADGIEVIEVLKLNLLPNHIYTTASAGLTFSKDAKKIMDEGYNEHLHKPFLIEQLQEKLDLFLQNT